MGIPKCEFCLGMKTLPIKHRGRAIRRNEKCPCGSGKKFKHCHMDPDSQIRLVDPEEAKTSDQIIAKVVKPYA